MQLPSVGTCMGLYIILHGSFQDFYLTCGMYGGSMKNDGDSVSFV